MYKLYSIVLLTVFAFGCEKKENLTTDFKPKYGNFENAWEQRKLFGKVKKIEWYKTDYQNDERDGEKRLILKEQFTKDGNLKETSNYNTNGDLVQKDVYEYDRNQLLVKTLSTNKLAEVNYVMTVDNDTVNNTSTRKIIVNDTLNQEIKFFYNDEDYVVKQIAIEKNDTTVAEHIYEFNDAGKIVSDKHIISGYDQPLAISKFMYNQDGNLIRYSYKTEWDEIIAKNKWHEDRITTQTEYTVSADSIRHLDQQTDFDELYNPIYTKVYKNSELNRELKYEYILDGKGNWIKREVSMKEHHAVSNKFRPIYSETRKIKYWE